MSNLIHGAEALERLALHYQDLMAARDALLEVGGLDATKQGLEKQIIELKEQVTANKGALTKAQAKLAAAQGEAERLVKDAEDRAQARIKEAEDKAQAILKEAVDRADAVLRDAKDQFDGQREAAESRIKDAERAVREADARLAEIEDARRAAQLELDAVNQKLADARAQIKKMMED